MMKYKNTFIKMKLFLVCIIFMNKLYHTHFIPNTQFLSKRVYGAGTEHVYNSVDAEGYNSQGLIV